jgi:CheY-like chemotaxis protein
MIATSTRRDAAPASVARPRVLVAEDDPNSRWVLCALIRRMGYDCRAVGNGREAVELVDEFRPRVILMDLMMPGVDGLEATRRLKAQANTRDIPIVALTGDVSSRKQMAAQAAGCDDFIPKPIVWPELLERLRRHLGESEG